MIGDSSPGIDSKIPSVTAESVYKKSSTEEVLQTVMIGLDAEEETGVEESKDR